MSFLKNWVLISSWVLHLLLVLTKMAIFYLSEYYDLPKGMKGPTGFIIAGKNRMLPIAMTTFAAILALMPLALAIGQGSAMQQPLAIAIISGLTIQLPLVLTLLPLFLLILHSEKS